MEAARPYRSPLIGRGQPLAELAAAVGAAAGGHGSIALVSGEPGIGKTRLAEEVAAQAAGRGLPTFWGRCDETEGQPPFWPWLQVLRDLALHLGPATLAAEVDPDAVPLVESIAEIRPHVQRRVDDAGGFLDAASERFRLFHGTVALLRRAATRQPLLLVIDDLHWADLASLQLLDFVSRELAGTPMLVIGTFREVEVRQSTAAADVVGRLVRRARSIALVGLTPAEVADFVASVGAGAIPEASAERLHAITDGNPFFLDEMLRLIAARGGELAGPRTRLPEGVLAVVRQRLRVLAPEVVQLLTEAAVVRREFDLALLEEVLAVPRTVLDDRLRAALECDVLRAVAGRPGCYRFAHALLHEAIRNELPASRRIALHRRCAEVLERRHAAELDAHVAEIARHYAEAALHGFDAKALDYGERAGDVALRALAFDEAVENFTAALEMLDREPGRDPQRRCDILLRLGDAANRASRAEVASDAFERAVRLARDLGSSVRLAQAAIGLGSIGATWAQYGRSDPRLVDVLREALDGLVDDEVGLRARLLARLAAELHFAPTPADTNALSAEAVALARQTGEAMTLVHTLPSRLRCSGPDDREERLGIVDELLALTGGRGELAVHACVWKLSEALQAGARTEMEACRERLLATVRDLRQPREQWLLPALDGQEFLCAGRLAQADAAAAALLGYEGLTPNGEMAALVLLFLIRREQGRLAELTEGMRAFAAQSRSAGAWRTNLALLLAETGREAEARAELDSLVAPGLPVLRRDNTWLLGVAGLAGAAARVGTPAQADTVLTELLPYAGRHVVAESIFYLGPVSYYLGILAQRAGRDDDARAFLDGAVAAARKMGSPPFAARALLARATIAGTSIEQRRASLAEVAAIADELELSAIQAALRSLVEEPVQAAVASTRAAGLARRGEAWALTWGGRTSHLRHRRGLDYLVRLLGEPGREFHVLDLATDGVSRVFDGAPAVAILDARAKQEMRVRLDELREELAAAEANADLGRAEKARAEIEAIGDHVAKAVGLGGRDRPGGTDAERARAAVTKALRAAIRQIGVHEEELADLLARSVRTGAFCRYDPIDAVRVEWRLDLPGSR